MPRHDYRNLVPDSCLHRELETLLRRHGGVTSVDEVCQEVLLLPAPPGLARALVEGLVEGDPRLQLTPDNRIVWEEPGVEEIWQRRKHFLVVDVETTDGMRHEQRIIEVGVCRVKEGRITEEWSQLVNPGRRVSRWIRNLTGITDRMLAAAPPFDAVAERLLDALEEAIVVAHHARFDVSVLNSEVSRLRGQRLRNHYLCTVELARHFLPGMRNYRLETLSAELGLRHEQPHRAGSDARATAELFTRMATQEDGSLARYLRPRPPAPGSPAEIVETPGEQIS